MATGNPVLYTDFSGGLNLQAGPYLLEDNQCQDCRNVYANKAGALTKRYGSTRVGTYKNGSAVEQITNAHTLFATTGTVTGFIGVGPVSPGAATDSIVKITTAGVATTLTTGLTVNKPWEWAQGPTSIADIATQLNGSINNSITTITVDSTAGAPSAGTLVIETEQVTYTGKTGTTFTGCTRGANSTSAASHADNVAVTIKNCPHGPYYGMNGTATPQFWDGAASSTAPWSANTGIIPTGTRFLIYAQDRMWATGDPSFPGRVWKTGVSSDAVPVPDPCNWDTDFTDDIDPDDGQAISAIGKVGPYVLVFKERKCYVISDASSGIYRTLSSSIGCISHRSIVETSSGTLFLSEDLGVCLTDGSEIRVVSENIKPMLDEVSTSQPLAYAKSVGTYYRDSYYLSIPYLDSKNSITLEYQLDTGAWWIHSFAAADFALLDSGSGLQLYAAGPSVATLDHVLDDSVYSDNSVAYTSYWEGPYWTWGAPHLNKRVTQYRIDGVGSWEVDAATTFGDIRERLDWLPWEEGETSGGGFGDTGTTFGGTGTFGPGGTITEKRYFTPTDGWGRAWSLKLYDDLSTNAMAIYSVAGFLRPRSD
jgi:hypothetical protein